ARIIAAGLQKILPDGSDMINDQAATEFLPPLDLWAQLTGVSNNRQVTAEEKEQFDSMEKSASNLLKAIEAAKNSVV
ncbi:MAG: hypothetical protein RR466_09025, partial [Hungatella sp.]